MFAKREDIRVSDLNPELGTKVTNLVQKSIVSEFQTVDVSYYIGDEKHTAKSYVNDIYLLFNQDRLAAAGKDTIQAWLNSLTPRSDALSELRKKCTDEQLMQICKSRYIQSPSELLAWSDYLNTNFNEVVSQLRQASAPAPSDSAAPASTETSTETAK